MEFQGAPQDYMEHHGVSRSLTGLYGAPWIRKWVICEFKFIVNGSWIVTSWGFENMQHKSPVPWGLFGFTLLSFSFCGCYFQLFETLIISGMWLMWW